MKSNLQSVVNSKYRNVHAHKLTMFGFAKTKLTKSIYKIYRNQIYNKIINLFLFQLI